MTIPEQDKGVIAALMERFENQRLPRALALNLNVAQILT